MEIHNLLNILWGVLASLLTAISGLIITFIAKWKKNALAKEKDKLKMESYREILNHVMGQLDLLLAKDLEGKFIIEMKPDLRKELLKNRERYHKLDILEYKSGE